MFSSGAEAQLSGVVTWGLKPSPPKEKAGARFPSRLRARGRRALHGLIQQQDAACGLGVLKRRPYKVGKGSSEPGKNRSLGGLGMTIFDSR